MTTTLSLPDSASTYTTALGNDVHVERLADGTAMVRGLKVFRVGKFRDSMGRPHEWTVAQLNSMVTHFVQLRENLTFPNVPVRRNHSRNVNDVIGYFESLAVRDKWLVADLHITEPDAADKIERKTFRSRSLEVGPYVDNNDQAYNPAVLGLAFVDIGAVEGLFNASDAPTNYFTITENPMSDAATFQQSQLDWAVAAAYAQGLADAPKPSGGGDLAPFEFTYGGQKSADPKAVQAYINTLETAAAEQRDAARKSYVEGLATAKKIPATQVDAAQAFVATMTDEQFAAYRKMYDEAPKLSTFEQHSDNGGGEPDADAARADEIAVLEGIIQNHRWAGMSEEVIATTPSFQKLVQLQNAK